MIIHDHVPAIDIRIGIHADISRCAGWVGEEFPGKQIHIGLFADPIQIKHLSSVFGLQVQHERIKIRVI
jgi:hypothetical protein